MYDQPINDAFRTRVRERPAFNGENRSNREGDERVADEAPCEPDDHGSLQCPEEVNVEREHGELDCDSEGCSTLEAGGLFKWLSGTIGMRGIRDSPIRRIRSQVSPESCSSTDISSKRRRFACRDPLGAQCQSSLSHSKGGQTHQDRSTLASPRQKTENWLER